MIEPEAPWRQAIHLCRSRYQWPRAVVDEFIQISTPWTAESVLALARDYGWKYTPTPWELEPLRLCCLTTKKSTALYALALAEIAFEVTGRISSRYDVGQRLKQLQVTMDRIGLLKAPTSLGVPTRQSRLGRDIHALH